MVHLKHCAQFCFSNLAIFALKSLAKHDFVLDFFSLRPGVRRDAQRGLRLCLPGKRGRPRGVPGEGHRDGDVNECACTQHTQKRLSSAPPRAYAPQILLKVFLSKNSKSFPTLFFSLGDLRNSSLRHAMFSSTAGRNSSQPFYYALKIRLQTYEIQ